MHVEAAHVGLEAQRQQIDDKNDLHNNAHHQRVEEINDSQNEAQRRQSEKVHTAQTATARPLCSRSQFPRSRSLGDVCLGLYIGDCALTHVEALEAQRQHLEKELNVAHLKELEALRQQLMEEHREDHQLLTEHLEKMSLERDKLQEAYEQSTRYIQNEVALIRSDPGLATLQKEIGNEEQGRLRLSHPINQSGTPTRDLMRSQFPNSSGRADAPHLSVNWERGSEANAYYKSRVLRGLISEPESYDDTPSECPDIGIMEPPSPQLGVWPRRRISIDETHSTVSSESNEESWMSRGSGYRMREVNRLALRYRNTAAQVIQRAVRRLTFPPPSSEEPADESNLPVNWERGSEADAYKSRVPRGLISEPEFYVGAPSECPDIGRMEPPSPQQGAWSRRTLLIDEEPSTVSSQSNEEPIFF